jgi:hypothetical protein
MSRHPGLFFVAAGSARLLPSRARYCDFIDMRSSTGASPSQTESSSVQELSHARAGSDVAAASSSVFDPCSSVAKTLLNQ